jgi:hypothetical protein
MFDDRFIVILYDDVVILERFQGDVTVTFTPTHSSIVGRGAHNRAADSS